MYEGYNHVLEAVRQTLGWRRVNVTSEELTFPPIDFRTQVHETTEILC